MRIVILFLCFLIPLNVCSKQIYGQVEETSEKYFNQVIDSSNGNPIDNAKITLPQKQYFTKTDKNGRFYLDAKLNAPTIMNVEKNGYKPFSLTIDKDVLSHPLVVGIEKSDFKELKIENDLCHIGDNSFSDTSANAQDFRINSSGVTYTKSVRIPTCAIDEYPYLIIGSIIGIDTLMARQIGQSNAENSYATPPEIYFNGVKIAEIQINSDNQEIKIPKNLVKFNQDNIITIKAGKNLFQTTHTDYDDIEFMNLYIDFKSSTLAGIK